MSTTSQSQASYLSPKAAADYLSIAYDTFTRLARIHGLRPDVMAGSRKRYRRETLDRFGRVMRDRAERGQ